MQMPRKFVEKNWSSFADELARLVSIPSVADPTAAEPGAPYGLPARSALDEIVRFIRERGLEAHVEDGYVAVCDVPGESDQQLGVIGHLDVVPAGPGWDTDPFSLTERDGWLLGRGVTDDKGPILAAFWALLYWCEEYDVAHGGRLPHPVRFIFGSDEEIGCSDVAYYRARHDDPAFLFTPDADFPVCYGEKGLLGATMRSVPIPPEERVVVELSAGTATNAVPGEAYAVLEIDGQRERIEFHGTSAHASTPESGESALKMLLQHLLACDALSPLERRYMEMAAFVSEDFYGESLGIAAQDDDFGRLTGVAGTMKIDGDCFALTYDVRFPASAKGEELSVRIASALQPWNDCMELEAKCSAEPFLINPHSAPVQALVAAFNEVTGIPARPFTMGGATYARHFSSACSFGMELPSLEKPDWVGGMHAANEGVSIEHIKNALEIYINAFGKLFEIDLT